MSLSVAVSHSSCVSVSLGLGIATDGGWWRRSGGRDGVGPSWFPLVMLTPSRRFLVIVGALSLPRCPFASTHGKEVLDWGLDGDKERPR